MESSLLIFMDSRAHTWAANLMVTEQTFSLERSRIGSHLDEPRNPTLAWI